MSAKHEKPSVKHRTAWHPLFVRVLRLVLPHQAFTVHSEHQLSHQPLRIDIVVIRKNTSGDLPPSPVLLPVTRRLGPVTLVEFKGPTDTLAAADFLYLSAYADLYCAEQQVDRPEEVHLMVVASRLSRPFRDRVAAYGGRLARAEPGVWEVGGLAHPLCCIETEIAGDHVMRFFSPAFLRRPTEERMLLTSEERAIFVEVYYEVEQFRKDPQAPLRYSDYEEFAMNEEEFKEAILARMSLADRLRGLSPEQRLQGLAPEQRLQGLSPEDLLKALSPEERERLKKLLLQ